MYEIKEQLKNLTISASQCSARLDMLEAGLARSEAQITRIENQECETAFLKQRVTDLEEQLNSQEQQSLRNELEILGLPETPNENPHHLVLIMASKIGVSINENDLDFVARVGSRKDSGIPARVESTHTRPLVVKFTRNNKRNEFLKAGRSRRNLSSADLEVAGPPRKLFFNERLTKLNRALFRDARAHKERAGFKFCWTSNGIILVRKREGTKPIVIRRASDLNNRFNESPARDPLEGSKDVAEPGTDDLADLNSPSSVSFGALETRE